MKVILIGDSYCINYNGGWIGWGNRFVTLYTNIETHVSAYGGAGFVSKTEGKNFYDCIVDLEIEVINKTEITNIVVLGGYNDMSVRASDKELVIAMTKFVYYCKSNYPNSEITISSCSVDYNSIVNQKNIRYYNDRYFLCADALGVKYFKNFIHILKNKSLLFFKPGDANSGFHPNTIGTTRIAEYLHEYLLNGYFDVKMNTYQCDAYVYFTNGDIRISSFPGNSNPEQPTTFMSGLINGVTLPFNAWVDLGSCENSSGENLLWGSNEESTANWEGLIINRNNGTCSNVIFKLLDKHIYANNISCTESITFNNNYYLSGVSNLCFDCQLIY